MFKKLVSNLPFSPSLISQLGFYATRLKKEQFVRKLGLIFTVFALVIQSFAIFSPPQSANAAADNDMITNGCGNNIGCVQSAYDNNTRGFGSFLDYFGITRDDLNHCTWGSTMPSSWAYSFGRQNYKGRTYQTPSIAGYTYFAGPLTMWGTSARQGFFCPSNTVGTFFILKECANIVLSTIPDRCPYNSNYPANDPRCQAPTPPSAKCNSLTATPTIGVAGKTEFNFHIDGSLYDGAQWTGYYMKYSKDGGTWQDGITSSLDPTGSGGAFNDGASWRKVFPDPGTYKVQGFLNTTNAGNGKTSDACITSVTVSPAPTAECKQLSVKQLSRTEFQLNATAAVTEGATVKGYKYTVKDSAGKVVFEQTFNSTDLTNSQKVTLPENTSLVNNANYTATLTVVTSLGNKTNETDCVKEIVIVPKDVCEFNPDIPADDARCHPYCELPENKDAAKCNTDIKVSKTAKNNTQGVDATTTRANAGDSITYTIELKNQGGVAGTVNIEDPLNDILEYADLTDNGGGTMAQDNQILTWNNVTVAPDQTVTRTFMVTVKNPVPSMARGQSLPTSYDCIMDNVADMGIGTNGSEKIQVGVNCPAPKVVEQVVEQLPATGAGTNMIVAGVIAAIVVFFYARSRQLGKEVRLVRKEFSAGTI